MPVVAVKTVGPLGPSVVWGGRTYELVRVPTVADYYRWTVEIMAPYHGADAGMRTLSAAKASRWCAEFITAETSEVIRGAIVEGASGHTLWTLGQRVLTAATPPRWLKIREAIDISWNVKGFDPGEKGRVCDCDVCSGASDEDGNRIVFDPTCIYIEAEVGPIDREIAALDVGLVAELWDKPYFLYRLGLATKTASVKQSFKRREEFEEGLAGEGSNQRVSGRSEHAIRKAQIARLKRNLKR